MKNVTEYNAAPEFDKFREVDAAELAEIIRDIRASEHTATTEWARDGWETDIAASNRAAELMDDFGHRVFVAQDEDGSYFATEPSVEMILVESAEVYLADFMEDGTTKRGLFYRGMRVTTAGCPSPAQNSGFYRGKEWVRQVSDSEPSDSEPRASR